MQQKVSKSHSVKPVERVVPNKEKETREILNSLKGSLVYYKDPTEPVGLDTWEVLK